MRKWNSIITIILFYRLFSVSGQTPAELKLEITKDHPMQYYISLPKGWTAARKWPVAVVLEAAEKEYKLNAQRFVSTRGDLPFILIAPFNTNNGNQGRRDPALFPYSAETWDYMEKVGDCQFNDEGIQHIIADVVKRYNGEEKVYMTGFEAGTHVLWSIVFNHPEFLKAAVSVAGNFRDRCIVVEKITTDASKKNFPIHSIVGEKDGFFGPTGQNYVQWSNVKSLAQKQGYTDITETVVSKKDHVPMPEEVWSYFGSLIGKK